MEIALLNQRILIQLRTAFTDELGNHDSQWEDYYSCAATISNESGAPNQTAGIYEDPAEIAFTIRYCKAALGIDPMLHRVVFSNQNYQILTVDHQSYKGDWIKISCKKEPV